VNSEHAEAFKERLAKVGIVRGFETQLTAENGSKLRIRNTARIHRDMDGKVSYVEGIVENVSRSWQSAGEHKEAARFRALYECGHVAVLTVGRSGTIQNANTAFQELSGYGAEEISSVEYSDLFEEGDRTTTMEELHQLLDGASSASEGVRTLLGKSRETRTVGTLSILVRDWDGEPDHVLVTMEEKSSEL
jgi:PAS domain S-box-containing protein